MSLCPPATNDVQKVLQEGARGRVCPWALTIKDVRNQGQHGTRLGAVGVSHQQTRSHACVCGVQTRFHVCVRMHVRGHIRGHVHGARGARDSRRLVSRRLVATVFFGFAALVTILYVDFCVRRLQYVKLAAHRSSSRRSSSDSSGMVLLKIAPRSNKPLARL